MLSKSSCFSRNWNRSMSQATWPASAMILSVLHGSDEALLLLLEIPLVGERQFGLRLFEHLQRELRGCLALGVEMTFQRSGFLGVPSETTAKSKHMTSTSASSKLRSATTNAAGMLRAPVPSVSTGRAAVSAPAINQPIRRVPATRTIEAATAPVPKVPSLACHQIAYKAAPLAGLNLVEGGSASDTDSAGR